MCGQPKTLLAPVPLFVHPRSVNLTCQAPYHPSAPFCATALHARRKAGRRSYGSALCSSSSSHGRHMDHALGGCGSFRRLLVLVHGFGARKLFSANVDTCSWCLCGDLEASTSKRKSKIAHPPKGGAHPLKCGTHECMGESTSTERTGESNHRVAHPPKGGTPSLSWVGAGILSPQVGVHCVPPPLCRACLHTFVWLFLRTSGSSSAFWMAVWSPSWRLLGMLSS